MCVVWCRCGVVWCGVDVVWGVWYRTLAGNELVILIGGVDVVLQCQRGEREVRDGAAGLINHTEIVEETRHGPELGDEGVSSKDEHIEGLVVGEGGGNIAQFAILLEWSVSGWVHLCIDIQEGSLG